MNNCISHTFRAVVCDIKYAYVPDRVAVATVPDGNDLPGCHLESHLFLEEEQIPEPLVKHLASGLPENVWTDCPYSEIDEGSAVEVTVLSAPEYNGCRVAKVDLIRHASGESSSGSFSRLTFR